jgi:hypothetical protein
MLKGGVGETPMLVKVIGVVPSFSAHTVIAALVVPTVTFPKASVLALSSS